MQVGVDVKCMHTNFGGCGLLVSEKKLEVKNFNQSKSAQNINASRD